MAFYRNYITKGIIKIGILPTYPIPIEMLKNWFNLMMQIHIQINTYVKV